MTTARTFDFTRLGPPEGAWVAVCGGCGGIGAAMVRGCVATKLNVVVLDLAAAQAAKPVPADVHFVPFDTRSEDSVRDAFAAVARITPKLDALINLVGSGNAPSPITETTVESFDEDQSRNLRSAFLISKHAMALLKASGAGSLIHTASGVAQRALPSTGAYAAAKAGVIALAKHLALENGPTVRVNVISPGGVTNRVANPKPGEPIPPHVAAMPLQRFADVEDLVGPALFLAGPMSGYLTGQTLHLSGGAITP